MILDAFDLHGKVALVTGASRGLGCGMAEGLAEAGADIVGVSRGTCDALAEATATLGRRFLHLPCDLATATVADLQALVARAVETMGGLDILVNAAGINIRHPSLEFPENDWDKVLNVNLKSVMFLSQAAARHFAQHGGGKIIMVASALSYQGGYTVPAYAASKHGILGLTRSLANEFAALHINVNAIVPGYHPRGALGGARGPPGGGRLSGVQGVRLLSCRQHRGGRRLAEPVTARYEGASRLCPASGRLPPQQPSHIPGSLRERPPVGGSR